MYLLSLKKKYCRVSTISLPPALSRVTANVQKQMTLNEAPLSARPRLPPVSAKCSGASAAPARSRHAAGGGGPRGGWGSLLGRDTSPGMSQVSGTQLLAGARCECNLCVWDTLWHRAQTGTPVSLCPSVLLLSLPSAMDFAVNLSLFLDTTASYSVGACSTRTHLQPAPAPAPWGRRSQPGTGTCLHLPRCSQGVCTGEGNTRKSSSGSSAYQFLY